MKGNKLFFCQCILAGITAGVVMGAVMLDYIFLFQIPAYRSMDEANSCLGVEKYYSGNGFMLDKENYLSDVFSYPHDSSEEYEVDMMDLTEVGNILYDCEDISHGISCIAREYGVKCNLYAEKTFGKIREDNHIGVECLLQGGWVELY